MYHPQTNVGASTAPFYRGLTDEQCRLIHCASLEILERTGVLLYYQPAIDLLKKAGCIVEENRVRIPAHLRWLQRLEAAGRAGDHGSHAEPVQRHVLKPHLAETGVESAGTVAMGTVKGDLHDIGKNLVAMMLEGAGFEVMDLGTDVDPTNLKCLNDTD
jgi:hypothetical protein